MRRIIAIILIFAGILMISFPKIQEAYYEHKQKNLMKAWQDSMKILESGDRQEEEIQWVGGESGASNVKKAMDERERIKMRDEYIREHTEGLLKIDAIDFYQPVLKGDTKENLNISVASIKNTGKPGEAGNYCIAGHRNRTYGRNFNRLGELQTGDIIEFIQEDRKFIYKIFEKLLVKPEETWVLQGDKSESLITLITCDYSEKPALRLIIRGELLK